MSCQQLLQNIGVLELGNSAPVFVDTQNVYHVCVARICLTLSGLNSVAAVTQRSRTGLRGQTPSALRRIRLLQSCLNQDGLRSAAGIHRPRISRAGCRDAQPRSGHHGSEPHTIGGAAHAAGTPVQDVGVDHRGADVTVAQQLVDNADVVAVPQRGSPLWFLN